ncbi:MAG: elongation factor G, partial [Dorea sp.]
TERYGKVIAPHFAPIRENEKLVGYVNVIKNAARRYSGIGQRIECDVPEYSKENLELYREKLLEAVAETSEAFMERYFEGDEFSVEEIRSAMRTEVMNGDIVPVAMGSNVQAQGVANLLSDIVRFFPSPEYRECNGINRKTNAIFEANHDFAKQKSAYVFKTMVDPFIGKYSFVKVCSGVLKGEDTLYNADTDTEAKLGKVYTLFGNKAMEVQELFAGDIGAIAKLDVKTGDTLSTKSTPILFGKTEFSKPYTYMKYVVANKGDEDKVSQALQRMMAEDVTLKTVNDAENRQSLIYGMGDQHLEIVASKLADRYKVSIALETPKVAFRETIKKKSDVDTKYKKQSGGHGQYGHVKMRFEPSGDLETPYVFEEEVVGGAVPKNYFPAVEKGLQESVVKGPLAGYPVVGVKAVLYDGSYHPVDSSEMAFKTATIQAFKKGVMEAGPVLLEPIASVKVTVPDDYTGDVMGDLTKRRGRVLGMTPVANGTVIEADVPMTGMFGYCTTLRAMTGGRGSYSYEFARYEQAPSDVQEAEIAKRAAEE